jgi:hypothetical protein
MYTPSLRFWTNLASVLASLRLFIGDRRVAYKKTGLADVSARPV